MNSFDSEWLRNYERKQSNRIKNNGIRECPKLQERQNAHEGTTHHSSKKEALDGKSHPTYRVSITWLVSDRRRRDAWGMSETIADCIVSAFRRFYGLHDTRTSRRPKSSKG